MVNHAERTAIRTKGDPSARERGLALLVVLWIVATAALLVLAFNAVVRSGATFVASEVELTEAQALLGAGLEIAAIHLLDGDQSRRWPVDGTAQEFSFAGATLTIAINDPNGLIDLNKASEEVLLGFFRRFAASATQAERIRDRIIEMRGDQPGKTLAMNGPGNTGTNAPAAAALTPAQLLALMRSSTEHAFLDVTEFRRMDGITRELYEKVAPYLTVYSRDGLINPNAAPSEVLSSIPQLTALDIERFFASKENGLTGNGEMPGDLQRAGAYLSDKAGPAYVVSVKAAKPGTAYALAKQFVIVIGLDEDAPYRVISVRSLSLGD